MTSSEDTPKRRVGIYGWGIVAPACPNIDAFRTRLASTDSWLSPFGGFGPCNFLVGEPDFDFEDYRPWIDERFPPSRFGQIANKMGTPTQYAVGAFIQSLEQNPGIEQLLKDLGTEAHVYVGTGLGDLPTISKISLDLDRAQRNWNRFWADPERNAALSAHLGGDTPPDLEKAIPPDPEKVPESADREAARDVWNAFWAGVSPSLGDYLKRLREIESVDVIGNVESGKASVIRGKMKQATALREEIGCPPEPWASISPNLLWNIHSAPACQISMVGKITGMCFAPVAACSTFGYALKLGMNAIQLGQAKVVVVGATDPKPHPLIIGAFSAARVLASDGQVSKPLTGFRGTHASGGSAVWILGDHEYLSGKGFEPVGMEPIAVGVSADAEHIITPSVEGPIASIRLAYDEAGCEPEETGTWDLHATATPGDFLEVENARRVIPESVLMTARKGTFGHGMGACGGWELTAQYLAAEEGVIAATPLHPDEVNPEIAAIHDRFVADRPEALPEGIAGKLSMGVGGINACILSRPWADPES
ncbi:MAG TPA: beta-ketoacyl synthase [Planctomycetes bacterium]|nr:beta-ketoacyl synthase [Planctomycetota bacterium]